MSGTNITDYAGKTGQEVNDIINDNFTALENSKLEKVSDKASDSDAASGTADDKYMTPLKTSKLITEMKIGKEWENLRGEVGYDQETFYKGNVYLINNPIADVTVAPPPLAGRSYINGDDFIVAIDGGLSLSTNDTIEAYIKFEGEYGGVNILMDSKSDQSRAFVAITATGAINLVNYFGTLDGEQIDPLNTKIPNDGIYRLLSIKPTINTNIGFLRKNYTQSFFAPNLGLYGLKVYNDQGEQIHEYELRNDAVDTLGGNLIKDPEFTWSGNLSATVNCSVDSNKVVFSGVSSANMRSSFNISIGTTVRFLYDIVDYSGGAVTPSLSGSQNLEPANSNGSYDLLVVLEKNCTGAGFFTLDGFSGSIKNFRVIKMNELSPSADFSSSAGFTTSGGVTIDTVNKQAVFGSGTDTKDVRFNHPVTAGKKYRFALNTVGRSTGTLRVVISGVAVVLEITNDGVYDVEVVSAGSAVEFGLASIDGWDGNVEYFSVTEVTDGTPSGTINKVYEKYWKKGFLDDGVGVQMNSFSMSTLPGASSNIHKQIFISDMTGGGAPAYSDGTNWKRFTDNSVVN